MIMRKLEAPDGYYYTQAADVEKEMRIYAKILFLANNDSEENYRLATEAEKKAWEDENE